MSAKRRQHEVWSASGARAKAPLDVGATLEQGIANHLHELNHVFQLGKSDEEIAAATEYLLGWAQTPRLPTHEELFAAERLYPFRPKGQTIIEFLQSGWPAELIRARALTLPDLRRLDRQAYMALHNWLRRPENKLPPHMRLLTKKQANDRLLADEAKVREARRLVRARERR